MLSLVKKIMKKILSLKSVILLEYQNKNIFAKGYAPNCSEVVFVIKKVKNSVSWTYIINDVNGKEMAEIIYEKEFQKRN